MSQAIITRFIGPTTYRGSRIKASCDAGSITVPWDYSLGTSENHEAAARALIEKLGWDDGRGVWFSGTLPGAGYVFINALNDAKL